MPQGTLHNGVSNQNDKLIVGTHCGEQRLLHHHYHKWRVIQSHRHRSRHATITSSSSLITFISCLVLVITSTSLINCVYCDDGSPPLSVYNLGPEITTEFGKLNAHVDLLLFIRAFTRQM